MSQTAAPVQFGELLAALQSDTREDLQIFLQEYSKALEDGGAEGFNALDQVLGARLPELGDRERGVARPAAGQDLQRILARPGEGRSTALVQRRGLAAGPDHELQHVRRLARARGRRARGLDPAAARHAARRPSRRSQSLDGALPSLRAFARDALPGVRSSDERSPRRCRSSPSCARSSRPPSCAAPRRCCARRSPTSPTSTASRCRCSTRAASCRRARTTCSCRSRVARSRIPTSPPTRTIESSSRCSTRSRTSRARAA